MNQWYVKNVSTSNVRRRLCEAGLYGRITVEEAKQSQKALVGQGTQRLDNRAVEQSPLDWLLPIAK